MRLVQSFLTKNPCYTAGKKITVKGLMLHSVGCAQPKASVFINSWNNPSYNNACVHGFIDGNDGTIYQTLPWNYRGWHCASGPNGSGNNTHIGVEMCEPACIKYTGGSGFTCSNLSQARASVKKTYEAAVELFAFLCKQYGLNPTADGVIISHKEGYARGIASNHGDPEHLWKQLGTGYTMDGFRKDVKRAMAGSNVEDKPDAGMKASSFRNLTEAEVIALVGPLFTADQRKSGVLASVSMAQFILESGYGKSELAQKANNCFGMKKSLSGNTWEDSSWDGKSIYSKKTQEQNQDGSYVTIMAEFRKYSSVEDSIADHSAYLKGAKNGSDFRYAGISGCTDYRTAAQIIKDGGYATSLTYVEKLCQIIEKWKLIHYDVVLGTFDEVWYRVRKNWEDAKSQVGAFHHLENAKKCADENKGYSVFDEQGKLVYMGKHTKPAFKPYQVKVSVSDLRIRKGPGTDKARTGKYTGKGIFTIVEDAEGIGASRWGLLKSYEKKRDGWISLDFAKRV